MPYLTLARTEKAYTLTNQNVFVLIWDELSYKPNKLEMYAILKKHGYTAENINVVTPYKKIKFRRTRANKVLQVRPRKYYVTLAKGQKFAEDLRLEA
jgi:ribosomal protein L23